MQSQSSLPAIVLARSDSDRLDALVESYPACPAFVRDYLRRELTRADVVDDPALPHDVVRILSQVTYRDDQAGRTRTVTLVYPSGEDAERGHVSVMTPIGAALIGLRAGQSIDWVAPSGARRALTVLDVAQGAVS
jgi:regulator of nucleoside diphosphate kinase